MKDLLAIQTNWLDLLFAALILWAAYAVFQICLRLLNSYRVFGARQDRVITIIRGIILIYEPLVLLVLGSIFILINPLLHGIIIVLFLFGGTSFIRSYLHGRILQFDRSLSPGTKLTVLNVTGIISKLSRLGLYLQTAKGRQFFSYAQLHNAGYLVLSGDEIGGFYQLKLAPSDENAQSDLSLQVKDLLLSSPYLDRGHNPEISSSQESNWPLSAKVLVRDEQHIRELFALLQERGFKAKLAKK